MTKFGSREAFGRPVSRIFPHNTLVVSPSELCNHVHSLEMSPGNVPLLQPKLKPTPLILCYLNDRVAMNCIPPLEDEYNFQKYHCMFRPSISLIFKETFATALINELGAAANTLQADKDKATSGIPNRQMCIVSHLYILSAYYTRY